MELLLQSKRVNLVYAVPGYPRGHLALRHRPQGWCRGLFAIAPLAVRVGDVAEQPQAKLRSTWLSSCNHTPIQGEHMYGGPD
mgnify:CR=1 FL=1